MRPLCPEVVAMTAQLSTSGPVAPVSVPGFERGRELTADEQRLFLRRRRASRALLGSLLVVAPALLYLFVWGATQPGVDHRVRTWPTGVKQVEAEYVGGTKHGSYVEYHQNGEVKAIGAYQNDLEEGHWEHFYWTGVRRSEGRFTNGAYDGTWRYWYSDGALKAVVSYERGVRQGVWRTWYPNGVVEAEQPYLDGYLHGEERSFFESGQLASAVTFRAGLENGPARYFYENGVRMAEGEHRGGQRHGVWRSFGENGDWLGDDIYNFRERVSVRAGDSLTLVD